MKDSCVVVFTGVCVGCIPLPGASGVQCLKGDVYRDQRDTGELITRTLQHMQMIK